MPLAELKWLLPLVIGGAGFIFCLIALIFGKSRPWPLILSCVLSASLVGASVLNKISVTGSGILVETAQSSLSSLESIEKTLNLNIDAMKKLSSKVEMIAAVTSDLANQPQIPNSIKEKAKELSSKAAIIDESLEKNQIILKKVGETNEIIKNNIQILQNLGRVRL